MFEIKELLKELNDLKLGLAGSKLSIKRDQLYNNKEIRLILGVDERLIKKYRDNGFLTYYRQGDKYWYQGSDIIEFLNKSKYKAFM
jgi:hypothetical protein